MSIRPWNSLSSYNRDMRTLARRIGPIQITPGKGSPIDTVRFDRSRGWNLCQYRRHYTLVQSQCHGPDRLKLLLIDRNFY